MTRELKLPVTPSSKVLRALKLFSQWGWRQYRFGCDPPARLLQRGCPLCTGTKEEVFFQTKLYVLLPEALSAGNVFLALPSKEA